MTNDGSLKGFWPSGVGWTFLFFNFMVYKNGNSNCRWFNETVSPFFLIRGV
jgi:hypothetical protein